MNVRYECPGCSRTLMADESAAGTVKKCTWCGAEANVPGSSPAGAEANVPGSSPAEPESPGFRVPQGAAGPDIRADDSRDVSSAPGFPSQPEPVDRSTPPPTFSGPVRPARSVGNPTKGVAGIAVGLVAAFFGFHAVGWVMGGGEPGSMKPYVNSRYAFSVDMPGGYDVDEKPLSGIRTKDGDPIECMQYFVDCKKYGLGVLVMNVPLDTIRNGRTDDRIARDALYSGLGNIGIRPKEITQDERPAGGIYRAEGSGTYQGQAIDAAAEAYLFADRTYVLVALSEQGDMEESPTVKRFFESFKLTE